MASRPSSVLLSAQHNRLRVRAVTMRKRIGPSLKLNLKSVLLCVLLCLFVCVCVVLVKDYMFKYGVPPTRFCTTFTPQPPSWDTDLRSSIPPSLPPRLRSLRPLARAPPPRLPASPRLRRRVAGSAKMQVHEVAVTCVPLPPPVLSVVGPLRLALLQGVAEPVEPLVQAVPRGRARGLDVPE